MQGTLVGLNRSSSILIEFVRAQLWNRGMQVWLRRLQWQLEQHEDGIQPIVNRALLCLPRHKHIKFISQAAILEFKSGVPARGRTMFEGMLREYPKRTDLWSVYLDQVYSFLFLLFAKYNSQIPFRIL